MNEIVQMGFDYTVLSQEQAQRTQDAEIRIIGRTQRTIVENGRDLLAVKQDIGHGHFVNWIKSLGISEDTAQRWMGAARNFGEIPQSAVFDKTAIYLLSKPKVPESAREEAKVRAADGEKITEDIARQIRDAHKAREQAEQQARQARQQLDLFKQEAEADTEAHKEEKSRLTKLIQYLNEEKEQIAQSKVQVLQEDTPETKAKLESLEQKLQDLKTQQRRLQAEKDTKENQLKQKVERVKELTEEVQKYAEIDKQERYNEQIRSKWRQACDSFHTGVNQGFSRLVTPLDAQQAFESDDWARLAEVEATLKQAIEKLGGLRESQFVDASMDYLEA
jgi:DNA repair exonuclease SbcCD ATPase subunit